MSLGLISKAEVYDKNLKVTLTFAPKKHNRDMDGMPQIQVVQMCNIVRTLYEKYHGEEHTEEDDLKDIEIINVVKQGTKGIVK